MLSYILALVVLVIVLVGNIVGPDVAHISTRYFDSVLHILAGFGLGFFFSALTASTASRRFHSVARVTGIVLCAGIAWELFEVYYDITGYELWSTMYYWDSAKDLVLDTVGGALAAYVVITK